MAAPTHDRWYRENLESLHQALDRLRHILAAYIGTHAEAQTEVPLEKKQTKRESKRTEPEASPDPPALAQLCELFHLSPFERDLLLLCAGMEIDARFESLFVQASGSPQRNFPTLRLAVAALPEANWGVFSPQNPLHYWQLLEVAPGTTLAQAPLQIDRRILCALLGEKAFDEQLMGLLKPLAIAAGSLPPSQLDVVDRAIASWSQRWSAIQLCGGDGGGRDRIAATLCQQVGLSLYRLSATSLPNSANDLRQFARRCQRECMLSNSALLLDCQTLDAENTLLDNKLIPFIDQIETPLILSSNERLPFNADRVITFEVPPLNYNERKVLWKTYLNLANDRSDKALNGQLDPIVAHFNLGSAAIQTACEQFKLKQKSSQQETASPKNTTNADSPHSIPHTPHPLWYICRTQARPHLDSLTQRLEAQATWDDLVLPENVQQVLRQVVAQVRQRARVYQEWGFATQSSRGLGLSTLFHGESGTGKTMAAEVLARELQLDLYRIDLSTVVSKYIGETEKNLRRIFDAAETGGAILLFDEADAIFGKRTAVQDSHDRYANIEVGYLLQRMEAYQGLAILTTNLKQVLDRAFLRRLRFMVEFPFPKAQARWEIWQRCFPAQTPTQGLDFERLSQLKVSGGNIRTIAMNAAFLAADAGEPVMMRHLRQATQHEYAKLEKSFTGFESKLFA